MCWDATTSDLKISQQRLSVHSPVLDCKREEWGSLMRWGWDATVWRSARRIDMSWGSRETHCGKAILHRSAMPDVDEIWWKCFQKKQLLDRNANSKINEDDCYMKEVCGMGCKAAMLQQRNVYLGQVDLSWVQVRQWQHARRNSIILLFLPFKRNAFVFCDPIDTQKYSCGRRFSE